MAFGPSIPVIIASPDANLDYGFDLSPPASQLQRPWLATGETVTDLSVTVDAGLTVNSSGVAANASGVPGALLVAWISGGVVGSSYYAHFQFTTSLGRSDMRSIQIQCVAR